MSRTRAPRDYVPVLLTTLATLCFLSMPLLHGPARFAPLVAGVVLLAAAIAGLSASRAAEADAWLPSRDGAVDDDSDRPAKGLGE